MRTPVVEGLPTENSRERLYQFLSLPLAGFVSAAHGDDEIDTTVAAAGRVLRNLAG